MDEKLLEHIIEIKQDISAMKADLANHIQRTEQNERAIDMLKKYLYMAHGALGLIGLWVSYHK